MPMVDMSNPVWPGVVAWPADKAYGFIQVLPVKIEAVCSANCATRSVLMAGKVTTSGGADKVGCRG